MKYFQLYKRGKIDASCYTGCKTKYKTALIAFTKDNPVEGIDCCLSESTNKCLAFIKKHWKLGHKVYYEDMWRDSWLVARVTEGDKEIDYVEDSDE